MRPLLNQFEKLYLISLPNSMLKSCNRVSGRKKVLIVLCYASPNLEGKGVYKELIKAMKKHFRGIFPEWNKLQFAQNSKGC